MKIKRGTRKAPIATDWATAINISGTGTNIVESAAMILPFPAEDVADNFLIEVNFTQSVTGGTGSCFSWTRLSRSILATTVADNTDGDSQYSQRTAAVGAINRRVFIKPLINAGLGGVTELDSCFLYVRSHGSAADTAWLVSNIKARLIYTPL